jgi:anti-repressor protein
MNDIVIAVNFENDKPTVSGRELHAALEIKTAYKDWFPRMREYGFVEGRDFNPLKIERVQNEGKRSVVREVTDHQLTMDMAKELCMIQRSEIGKRCREYFLEIERKWNSPEAVLARALLIANHQLQLTKSENTKLLEENTAQSEKIKGMLPKASYYDYVLSAEGLMPISTIAKDYGKSARWLNKWLHEQGIQYKQGQVWLLYQKYADMGYVKSKTYTVSDENGNPNAKLHTCWTQKGRLMIYELLKEHGILPLIECNE